MQPLLTNPTTLAVDWKGDAAFQGLFSGFTLQSLLISCLVITAIGWVVSKRWGVIATVVLGVMGSYAWNHFIKNGGKGDAAWNQMMSLGGVFGFLGSLVAIVVLRFFLKQQWGFIVCVALALFLNIFLVHWLFPVWDGITGELNFG